MTVNRDSDAAASKPASPTPQPSAVFGQSFQESAGAQNAGNSQRSNTSDNSRTFQRGPAGRFSSLRTGMGRRRPAADLEQLKTSLGEEFKNFTNASAAMPEAQNFKLLMLDRNRLNKKVDLLVAILPIVKDGGQMHVAIHTMLIADANDKYEPITVQTGARSMNYSTVVGDAYTEDLFATIVDAVSSEAGVKIVAYDAGHQTLAAEMDVKDRDALHKIGFFVTEALTRTALQSILKSSEDIVSLSDLGDLIQTTAYIDFSTVDDANAAGNPIRSDYTVKLRYSEPNQKGQNQTAKAFDMDQQIPLGGGSGYIDLIYRAPEPPEPGRTQETQHYFARSILTRLDTDQDLITPELQLLSLLGHTLIARHMNYARFWSPAQRGLHGSGRDIGAIGFELQDAAGNYLGRIPTNTPSFDDAQLAKFVRQTIRPDLIMSIDIGESDELSWLNRVLLAAAQGDREANASIITAMDNLTNGNFSPRWHGGQVIFSDNNRVHNGYYMDDTGKRDIRALDTLMILDRFGESDPQMAVRWQNTWDDTDLDAEVRLAEREDLIRRILGNTVVITGYSQRANFAPDLLETGLDAAAAAGLRIRPENTLINFGGASTRGRPDLANMAFGGQAGRGVFNQANTGGGRGWSRGYQGRNDGWR